MYDDYQIPRKGYSQNDVAEVILAIRSSKAYEVLTSIEKALIEYKFKALKDKPNNRYYELLNKIYIPEKDREEDTNLEVGAIGSAVTDSGIHYVIIFFLFTFLFSEKKSKFIVKGCAIICVIFYYIEVLCIYNTKIEENIESYIPLLINFTLFQKKDLLRAFFHFCLQFTVCASRIIYDSEKENLAKDLENIHKAIAASTNTCFGTVSNWSLSNDVSEKLGVNAAKENPKKRGWCTIIVVIIVLPMILSSFMKGIHEIAS